MKIKTRLLAGFATLCALAAWYFSSQTKLPEQNENTAKQAIQKPSSLPRISFPNAVDHPVLESSIRFQTTDSNGEQDLEIIEIVMNSYRQHFDGNPVGENEEIFAALRGQNPKGIRFLPDSFRGLQSDGKVHDRWGTPWRFHAISAKEMEILSAGPDLTFGSLDDIYRVNHQ